MADQMIFKRYEMKYAMDSETMMAVEEEMASYMEADPHEHSRIQSLYFDTPIGCFLSMVYTYKNKPSKSFLLTLGLLPAIVCVVIMMVNGNIGAGVAVAGAFSLVRFRSAPGTAREIVAIFLAMGTGLICGMGYLGYAVLFAGILGIIILVFNLSCDSILGSEEKLLRITVPEDLDYAHEFDDVLSQYTENYHLNAVKTTNMGSLFKLTYSVTLKNEASTKRMIDDLRIRNGNLEISLCDQQTTPSEL